MSLPTITLFNLTGGTITLDQLGVEIPSGGNVPGPTFASVQALLDDPELAAAIEAGNIRVDISTAGGWSSGDATKTPQESEAIMQPLHDFDVKHNVSAGAAPTVTDDEDAGYSVNSQWLVPSTGQQWYCIDNTAGAAVWLPYASGDWQSIQSGRSASTAAGDFYRGVNGMILDAGNGGIPVRAGNLRSVRLDQVRCRPRGSRGAQQRNRHRSVALVCSGFGGGLRQHSRCPWLLELPKLRRR